MADIFVSYKRQDEEQKGRVTPIVQALEAEGFDVFYDVSVPPGSTWEQVIQSKIDQSKCVLVLWSEASVASDWVKEEAEIAKEGDKIIPVFLDPVRAPFGFSRIEGANLVGWDGDLENVEWTNLVAAVKAMIGQPSKPKKEAVSKVAMPITTTSKPSTPKGNSGSGGAGKVAIAALVLAIIGAGSFFVFQAMQEPQRTKPERDAIAEAEEVRESTNEDYRAQAKEMFSSALDQNSIEGFEAFIRRFPDSEYVEEAKALIERLKLAAAAETPTPTPQTPGVISDAVAARLQARLREDCIGIAGPVEVQALPNNGGYRLVDTGRNTVLISSSGTAARAEMYQARNLVNGYELKYQCFVGRPNAPLSYWKSNSGLPSGRARGEDCLSIEPTKLDVRERGGMFYLYSDASSLVRFDNAEDAKQAMDVLTAYRASQICYVGRPDPSMMYLK
ncbi:MAG: hypothetical protein CMK09_10680 [Ponticaulis sp.]|nr:hypothetical protein [Ponticaulis sp.]|tara:strand:- start:39557 stop:40894 length:1338 start_codon:yes stop_codon:yes gene_type:complete